MIDMLPDFDISLLARIVLVILTSTTASFGNTLLKVGASRESEEELLEVHHLPRTFLKPAILGGVAVYGVSQILWITVLRILDLSQAYPLMIGLNFTLIMFIAWSYFKEPVSAGKLFGVGLIFAGIGLAAAG
ncbi:MAG: SMR family transporter [Thermoleophilia bacterium]